MTNRADLREIATWGRAFSWRKGTGDWVGVQTAIARHQPVQVTQEAGSTQWQTQLPIGHPFVLDELEVGSPSPRSKIWISPMQRQLMLDGNHPQVQWHPSVLWVGIGCQRGASQGLIAQAVAEIFQSAHLAIEAIAGIATLDRKADEPGLVAFCRDRALPLQTFSAAELSTVAVPTPAAIVRRHTQTPSIAEAAALLAAAHHSSFPLALVPPRLRLPKTIFRLPDQPAVTIAVAQADREATDSVH